MGKVFGCYEITRRLGAGRVTETYLAVYHGPGGFKKKVAIKRISPKVTENKEVVLRLIDEARSVARLSHPNLVQIYQVGRVRDSVFITMEHVHGVSLALLKEIWNQKKRSPFPEAVLAKIACVVCDVLDFIPINLTHGDLTTSSLMLSFNGTVKVLDLGLSNVTNHFEPSQLGSLMGKAAYLSPEQLIAQGSQDKRSDFYSLGVILFELATGRLPFIGLTEPQIMQSVLGDPTPDPKKLNPELSQEMADIINRALAKDPNQRYSSVHCLRSDLESVVRSQPPVDSYTLADFVRELIPLKETARYTALNKKTLPQNQSTLTPAEPLASYPKSSLTGQHTPRSKSKGNSLFYQAAAGAAILLLSALWLIKSNNFFSTQAVFQPPATFLAHRVSGALPKQLARAVTVKIHVDMSGQVVSVTPLTGEAVFEKTILTKLQTWQFKPFMIQNRVVPAYSFVKLGN